MSEIQRMKEILKEMEVTPEEMANRLGITPRSYQSMTAPSAKVTPKWVTSFLLAWDLGNADLLCPNCKVRTGGHGTDYLFCEECWEEIKS